MKHILFAVSFAILALGGCSTPDADPSQPERTELQPGYWDPK
jgi:hypothetical protein